MKTFRIFGLDITLLFSVKPVKRLIFDLPDWADDTCITNKDVNGASIPHKIKYYRGSTSYYIDLPKCKDAKCVSITPMYFIDNHKKVDTKNRKIVVDLFL